MVRAAVAEVEDYERIEVRRLPRLAVRGPAVADLTHLIAELLENATVFAPHTAVQVHGERAAKGFTLEIHDRGLGMAPEALVEANQRLAETLDFELSDTDRLGLFVVSRLAQRQGVRVSLQPSPYGGTTAVLLIPAGLLTEPDEAEPESDGAAERAASTTGRAPTSGSRPWSRSTRPTRPCSSPTAPPATPRGWSARPTPTRPSAPARRSATTSRTSPTTRRRAGCSAPADCPRAARGPARRAAPAGTGHPGAHPRRRPAPLPAASRRCWSPTTAARWSPPRAADGTPARRASRRRGWTRRSSPRGWTRRSRRGRSPRRRRPAVDRPAADHPPRAARPRRATGTPHPAPAVRAGSAARPHPTGRRPEPGHPGPERRPVPAGDPGGTPLVRPGARTARAVLVRRAVHPPRPERPPARGAASGLPKRVRQASLAPQLKKDPLPPDETDRYPVDTDPERDAEQARATMASLQRAGSAAGGRTPAASAAHRTRHLDPHTRGQSMNSPNAGNISAKTSGELNWLLDELVGRVGSIRKALVLSGDGLPTGGSRDLTREDAEHLAAVASGFHSLAKGVGRHFEVGRVRQTIVELDDAFLFVTAAGDGSCLAVLADAESDVGQVAYEMTLLVKRVGVHLGTPNRTGG
ncbi:roadblock/LC7 domain-containing protein [Streptomyces sp. M19]